MSRYCFGVDLGGVTTKIGMFSLDGAAVEKWEIPTRTSKGGKNILIDIATSIADKMNEMELSKAHISGVGIGVPGPVVKQSIVNGCVSLGWGLDSRNVAQEFTDLTGLPCKVENDANVAALGEQWQGAGKGYDSLILFTFGRGAGSGIIDDGMIISGKNGAAGEIGHMQIVDEADYIGTCECGKRGCLEQVSSIRGVESLAKICLRRSELPSELRRIQEPTIDDVFEYAKMGDVLALQIIDLVALYIGKAAAAVGCVINPGLILISTEDASRGRMLMEGIEKNYKKYVFGPSRDIEFKQASLGRDAGVTGAAKLVLGPVTEKRN